MSDNKEDAMKRTTKGTIIVMILAFSLTVGIIGSDAAYQLAEFTKVISAISAETVSDSVTFGWSPKYMTCQIARGGTGVTRLMVQSAVRNSSGTFANVTNVVYPVSAVDVDTRRFEIPGFANTPIAIGKAIRIKCLTGCTVTNTVTPTCTFTQ